MGSDLEVIILYNNDIDILSLDLSHVLYPGYGEYFICLSWIFCSSSLLPLFEVCLVVDMVVNNLQCSQAAC